MVFFLFTLHNTTLSLSHWHFDLVFVWGLQLLDQILNDYRLAADDSSKADAEPFSYSDQGSVSRPWTCCWCWWGWYSSWPGCGCCTLCSWAVYWWNSGRGGTGVTAFSGQYTADELKSEIRAAMRFGCECSCSCFSQVKLADVYDHVIEMHQLEKVNKGYLMLHPGTSNQRCQMASEGSTAILWLWAYLCVVKLFISAMTLARSSSSTLRSTWTPMVSSQEDMEMSTKSPGMHWPWRRQSQWWHSSTTFPKNMGCWCQLHLVALMAFLPHSCLLVKSSCQSISYAGRPVREDSDTPVVGLTSFQVYHFFKITFASGLCRPYSHLW